MNKREKEKSMPEMYWLFILLGIFFAVYGGSQIVTGKPDYYKGTEVPAWAGFVTFPYGLWMVFVSIRALWRGRGRTEPEKPEPPKTPAEIDEEIARAKAAADAEYLRQHGKLPETPKKAE